ncbi:hypothetical protein SAT01_32620 [Sinomonas atrocyanea]|nr:hypothetical protein SAT01_32620 [Sinomonas atrocyanea]GGG61228.1 hypothetical protein GCM10007172_10350 [Sinomonas atrocyanea]
MPVGPTHEIFDLPTVIRTHIRTECYRYLDALFRDAEIVSRPASRTDDSHLP